MMIMKALNMLANAMETWRNTAIITSHHMSTYKRFLGSEGDHPDTGGLLYWMS